jgi:hypothetical protein
VNKVHDQIQHLGFVKGRIAVLSCGCRSGKGKNSRADDGADAQRRQRPRAQRLSQPLLGLLRVGDQLVNGLLG